MQRKLDLCDCRGGNIEVDPTVVGWKKLADGRWLVKGGGIHRFSPGLPELLIRPCPVCNGKED